MFAATQLAQTTMRSELGKIELDQTFQEREKLNEHIVKVRPRRKLTAQRSRRCPVATPHSPLRRSVQHRQLLA